MFGHVPPFTHMSRHDVIWQPIVTIYSDDSCKVWVITVTISSGDVTPPQTCSVTYPPHLSIKPCLDMTSFGNLLLQYIAMTHAGCGLKLCTVTINSDDIP